MSWVLWLTLLATLGTIDGQLFNLFGLTVTTNKILGDKLTSELGSTLTPTTTVSSMLSTSKHDKVKSPDMQPNSLDHVQHVTYQGQYFGANCPLTFGFDSNNLKFQSIPPSPFDRITSDFVNSNPFHMNNQMSDPFSSPFATSLQPHNNHPGDIDDQLEIIVNRMIQLITENKRRK